MELKTKFNIGDAVCFKTLHGGVMRGVIRGLQVSDRFAWKKPPSDYELSRQAVKPPEVLYAVHVRTRAMDDGAMHEVDENQVALTFDDAWKL